jgi:hypothetical protein
MCTAYARLRDTIRLQNGDQGLVKADGRGRTIRMSIYETAIQITIIVIMGIFETVSELSPVYR